MKTYELETFLGDNFNSVAKEARGISLDMKTNVKFDFNGITCIVNQSTNLDLLYRDYKNAHTMNWNIIGPECKESYDQSVYDELELRTKINEYKAAKRAEEYRKEQQDKKDSLNAKIKGIDIELIDHDGWNKIVEANKDPYGITALDYASNWAKLMQYELSNGKTIAECASPTSYEADTDGITGFMHSCAKSILVQTWKYGNELRDVK